MALGRDPLLFAPTGWVRPPTSCSKLTQCLPPSFCAAVTCVTMLHTHFYLLLTYFWLYCVACRILSFWAGIKPVPPALKHGVLSPGPPGKFPRVSISKHPKSASFPYLTTRPGQYNSLILGHAFTSGKTIPALYSMSFFPKTDLAAWI